MNRYRYPYPLRHGDPHAHHSAVQPRTWIRRTRRKRVYTDAACIECHRTGSDESGRHIAVETYQDAVHGQDVTCQDCHTGWLMMTTRRRRIGGRGLRHLPRAGEPARPTADARIPMSRLSQPAQYPTEPIQPLLSMRINCRSPAADVTRPPPVRAAIFPGFRLSRSLLTTKRISPTHMKRQLSGMSSGRRRPWRIGTDQRPELLPVPFFAGIGRRCMGGNASRGGPAIPTGHFRRRIDIPGLYCMGLAALLVSFLNLAFGPSPSKVELTPIAHGAIASP